MPEIDEPIARADEVALSEVKQLETAVEIAKDIAPNSEVSKERDALLEEIRNLKKRLDETIGERDLFKKERDEANENLRTMETKSNSNSTEFDEIFGGKE